MDANRSLRSHSEPPRGDPAEGVRLLEAVGTFPAASAADLATIVDGGQLVTVPADWALIWDKTPADKAYVILSGEVTVRRDDEELARLGAGDIIGEIGILQRKLRSAAVIASSPLTVLHFSREQVERLHAEVPAFRTALDAAAADHS